MYATPLAELPPTATHKRDDGQDIDARPPVIPTNPWPMVSTCQDLNTDGSPTKTVGPPLGAPSLIVAKQSCAEGHDTSVNPSGARFDVVTPVQEFALPGSIDP